MERRDFLKQAGAGTASVAAIMLGRSEMGPEVRAAAERYVSVCREKGAGHSDIRDLPEVFQASADLVEAILKEDA